MTVLEFDRALNTFDTTQDIVIDPLANMNVLWAYQNIDPTSITQFSAHIAAGSVPIRFNRDVTGILLVIVLTLSSFPCCEFECYTF